MTESDLVDFLQIHLEKSLNDLWEMCQGNTLKWKTGLKDIPGWDSNIIDEETNSFLEVCPEGKLYLSEHLTSKCKNNIPLDSYIFNFMIKLVSHPTIINRDYWNNYGHLDRAAFVGTIMKLVDNKIPKVPVDQTTTQVSKASKFSSVSKMSKSSKTKKLVESKSTDYPPPITPDDSVSQYSKSTKASARSKVHDSALASARETSTPAYFEDTIPEETPITGVSHVSKRSSVSKASTTYPTPPSEAFQIPKTMSIVSETKELEIDPEMYAHLPDDMVSFADAKLNNSKDADNITGISVLR